MHTRALSTAVTPNLSQQLLQRQAELQSLLRAVNDAAVAADTPCEVTDFKDVAAEDTRAVVDEVSRSHAAGELVQIGMALRRVAAGTYGLCEDCGEPIDQRRLLALPATSYCTACQAIHERPARRP